MTPRRSRRRASIVLAEAARPRRRNRGRDAALDVEALEAPMPGRLLVLLSRLHRAEPAKPETDDGAR